MAGANLPGKRRLSNEHPATAPLAPERHRQMPQGFAARRAAPISNFNSQSRLRSGPKQVCAFLCALALGGCATKSPKPPDSRQIGTTETQPAQPKPKRPFLATAFSWLESLPTFSPRKPKAPPAQVPRLIGVIKMVDRDDRFVLIDATTFQATAAGDLLVCIRDQKETANLRMGNLKNPPFLIADIASGNPSPGDRVFKP